jgi:orotidine-5'-phosphate decarboxylase
MAPEVEAPTRAAVVPFADRLADAVARKRSQLVVGLDPRVDLLPVELRGEAVRGRDQAAAAVARFCRGIVDAVAPYVVGVKPQLAFFEALGAPGMRALADALTVNAYLGRDSLEPFLLAGRRHGAGIFCLVKTSNPGGAEIQDLTLSDGRPLWHQVARLVAEWGAEQVGASGLSSVGAVVGATHPRAVGEARRLMPQAVLLLPGIGAQGASPADLARAFTSGPASALVTASRSILYAYRATGDDWRRSATGEAARLRREVWAVSGW